MNDKIKLNKEKEDKMIWAIKEYFLTEREEELGDLASRKILNFVMKELAPEIYNQGVYDSYNFMSDRFEEVLGIQK